MKIILFDLMDTLIVDPFPESFLWLLKKKNLTFDEFQKHKNSQTYLDFELGEIGEYEFFRNYYLETVSDDLKSNLVKPAKIKKEMYKKLSFLGEMENLLNELAMQKQINGHFKMGIASNYSEWYNIILNRFSVLENAMDYLFFSCEMNVRKPDLGFYRIIQSSILSSLEIRNAKFLFIDDKSENLKTADQMGWSTILMTSNKDVFPQIQEFLEG